MNGFEDSIFKLDHFKILHFKKFKYFIKVQPYIYIAMFYKNALMTCFICIYNMKAGYISLNNEKWRELFFSKTVFSRIKKPILQELLQSNLWLTRH